MQVEEKLLEKREENMGLIGKKGGCNQYKVFIFDPMLWMEKQMLQKRGGGVIESWKESLPKK